MHAATVQSFGSAPVFNPSAPDLPAPTSSQLRLKILASAVHRLVSMRAKGQHFSATSVPVDPSSDGVGLDEDTGKMYYIGTFAAPTFASHANVERVRLAEIPAGADPVTVAALTNPVQSGWMSLSERVTELPKDFSALIIGATGTSGKVAVQVARRFGAARVIGMARNEAALKAIPGLDEYIVQAADPAQTDFSTLGQVDIILDYVYGPAAVAVLKALKTERETQYVNVGTVAGDETIALPAQLLRSKQLRMTGSAPGSWSLQRLGPQLPEMLKFTASLERPADVVTKPLSEVEKIWDAPELKGKRVVLKP